MDKKVKVLSNVFIDVMPPFLQSNVPVQAIPGKGFSQDTGQLRTIEVGEGSKVFRSDRQGIWLGGKKFATAPFRVDMQGNAYMASATIEGLSGEDPNALHKADADQQLSGSINVGATGGNVKIDGANKRILINDGTTNRILIGFQSGGF